MNTGRLTAEERRESIVAAARLEFASGGYKGTSTEDIARRAGVSQPYLFRLFGTKKELFLATVHSCFGRCWSAFEAAAAGAEARSPEQILEAMGQAYVAMLADRTALRLQLQAYAASEDPDIREAVRAEFDSLYLAVSKLSKASPEALYGWFSKGMLLNVQAALAGDTPGAELLVAEGGLHATPIAVSAGSNGRARHGSGPANTGANGTEPVDSGAALLVAEGGAHADA